MRGTPEERFWSKVDRTDTCWNWTATTEVTGYGRFTLRGKKVLAHRFSYEQSIGAIPEGMFIDHTCHVRHCVNPDHLRPVTKKQNGEHRAGASRNSKSGVLGVSPYRDHWRATMCHNGALIYVGAFSSVAEAEAAVIAKRLELFTHNDLDKAA